MTMRGIETAATASLLVGLIPFIIAWESTHPGAEKYRQTVKTIYYTIKTVAMSAAWIACGLLARLLAPLDPRPATYPGPRPADSFKGLKHYLYRRTYRGRHYSGVPLIRLLTKEPNGAVAT